MIFRRSRRRRPVAAPFLAVFLLLAPVLARDPAQPPNPATAPVEPPIARTQTGTYTNPLGVNLADPDVLLHDGVYYLYATSITNLGYFVWTSTDLVHWRRHEEMALSRDHLSWGNSNFWAPDAIHYNGKFYLFYNCVGPVGYGRMSHRLCAAISDNPLGPFKEVRGPLWDAGKAMIDAHVFLDPADNDKPYLYYSLDHSENVQPNGRQASQLYVVPLAADLLSVAGEPTFCFGATQTWEGKPKIEDTWNEAPFVFRRDNGTYVMMYSARVFSDPLYAVGYATSKSPLGPWEKAPENPILKRTRRVSGPGHNCVVPSPDGSELFVVYHTHQDLDGGHDRELNIDRLTITDEPDGGVKLRILGPTRTPQLLPSGARVPSSSTRPVAAGIGR
jgi:beta-xylosidase